MQDSQSAVSRQPSAVSRRAHRLSPPTPRRRRLASRRSAFTLTELLIVIAIIGILASLIAAAAVNAMRAARRGQTLLEIKNIAGAMENFKNDYGAYPPNGMNPDPSKVTTPGSPAALVKSDFTRAFKKAFPKHQEPQQLIDALSGNGSTVNLPNGMTAAEALCFWLGGFSSDEIYPISGPNGPSFLQANGEVLENRARRYEFDLGRLGPRNDNGTYKQGTGPTDGRFLVYQSPIPSENNANRQINLWRYSPKGSEQPLVYFDTSRHKPYQYDVYASPTATNLFALKKVREGLAAPNTLKDIAFVDNKFQILHAGLDDDWGDFGPSALVAANPSALVVLFPTGPFIGPIADTLTNFTDGTLADASEQ